ncbi:hypothetical protein ABS648_13470 [Pseudomonas solani]|uniref:Uncharacterized protein n=1 Tax=Pseudomonas solani TaxID=2731552 RepID=A0AAU7YCF3_9PSED
MKTYSRSLLLMFGIALVLLAVSSLVVALNLSRDVALAQQQTQAWKNYAMAVHQQSLLAVHADANDCRYTPCCMADGEGSMDNLLQAAELHARMPGSQREQLRGLSF